MLILGNAGFISSTVVNTKKLETGLRTISAGAPYVLLLRIEAFGSPAFGMESEWGSLRDRVW